jgi:copper chaperone CopZ
MRQIFYVILLLMLALKAYANHHKVDIDVNGLVCEFCAVTIEKGFEKKPEIQEVKVDLEVGKVFITFTDGNNLTDEELTHVIINNGYNVAKINRNLYE